MHTSFFVLLFFLSHFTHCKAFWSIDPWEGGGYRHGLLSLFEDYAEHTQHRISMHICLG